MHLDNVLYAPELGRNLVSLGALLKSGRAIDLDINGATIYTSPERRSVEAHASLNDCLFVMDLDHAIWTVEAAPQANVATTAVAWHKRLGHIGSAVLQQMSATGQIGKVTREDLEQIAKCGACVMGKGARIPFVSSTSTTSQPLELLHSDVCGPLDASIGGVRYVLLFVDDYTRMAWVCLLKTKDQVFEAFRRLRAHLELSSGHRVKTLRTDGGGEYGSTAMENYLADAGILHQTTCPNLSQQNGVAERLFRTLFDRVRCMLAEAGMAWGWWAEAMRTAVYIYNRVPHSRLANSSSPLSVWLGKPIDVRNIRIFGSKCYAIDTSKHRKKSSPRAVECRVLGLDLSSKGYRLQVVGTVKVIKSRDVIFHEDHALPRAIAVDTPVGELEDSVGDKKLEQESAPTPVERPIVEPVQPRRSGRERKATWKVRELESNVATAPKSFREAMQSSEAEGWKTAINSEFNSWCSKDVYEVVSRPEHEEVIPTMLLFNRKTNPDGEEIRKKARCVVIGSRQSVLTIPGTSTSSPVASATSFRLLAAVAAHNDYEFQQMDVNTAYLHAPLKRPTYIGIPPGFPSSELLPGVPQKDQALKLNKAVYGLRDAPFCWYSHCSSKFVTEGFEQSKNDKCLFSIAAPNSNDLCHVLIYVDDFTLVTKSPQQMLWLKAKLAGMFDIKDLGEADQVLGMEVTRDRSAKTLILSQKKYTRQLLEEYDMLDCRPLSTPMLANALKTLPSHENKLSDDAAIFMRDKDYRRLLGCLNWLAQGTRPDIAYAVSRLGQAQSNPHPAHWHALKHILRYLSTTLDMGLTYQASSDSLRPHMFTDSSFADCPITRKLHSGYVTMLAGAAVSWSSKKQAIVTTSSTDAEYIGMGHCAKEGVWITRLLNDLGVPLSEPIEIFADNQSSMILADSEKTSGRTKHIDVQYHFIREYIQDGKCQLSWVPTKLNTADVFTKPLGPTMFYAMPPRLGLPWQKRLYAYHEDESTNTSDL
ncbi:Pol polyprotein/retrotransposon [Ceratobasidium sp. AG-Ba]|nr:Pol polyprotein/retrotransposon [Ceratobasidium sp. AG-Ba]